MNILIFSSLLLQQFCCCIIAYITVQLYRYQSFNFARRSTRINVFNAFPPRWTFADVALRKNKSAKKPYTLHRLLIVGNESRNKSIQLLVDTLLNDRTIRNRVDSILHLLVSLPQKRRHVGFEEAARTKRPRDESTKRTRCFVLPFLPLSLSLRLWSLVFYSNEAGKRRNCTRGKRVRRASSFDEIPRKKTKKGERVKRKERKKEARNGKRSEEEDPPERSSPVRFLLVDQIFERFDRFESSLNTKAFLAWKNRTKSTNETRQETSRRNRRYSRRFADRGGQRRRLDTLYAIDNTRPCCAFTFFD